MFINEESKEGGEESEEDINDDAELHIDS